MMNIIRSAQNPQAALSQIMPQYSQIMNIIHRNGGDAQKAFYEMANQMGVNGDEIINMLK